MYHNIATVSRAPESANASERDIQNKAKKK